MCLSCAVQDAGPIEEWPQPTGLQWAVSDAIKALYELDSCGAGGPLHIIVDDNNVEDHCIESCLGYIAEWDQRHSPGQAQAEKAGKAPHLIGAYEVPAAERARVMALSIAILWGLQSMTVAERAITIELRTFDYPAYQGAYPAHWDPR